MRTTRNHQYCFSTALCLLLFLIVISLPAAAKERHSDPDGCFSCHGLEGLQFIDEDGVLRVTTIQKNHYYSSLHGSVPCKDCHRKIRDYPHDVENGYVDCAESCHVDEPSEGEAFTHKPIVEEFEKSAHGEGKSKDFAGGNRLKEDTEQQDPSCRRCHSNTLYLLDSQMEKFKDALAHTETECGTCHQGEVWRNQFGGHVLRRLIGSRWKKNDANDMCNGCHADTERMAKVEIEDLETKEKNKVDFRWVHASESYARSLHNRMLVTEIEQGAACLDCHAPSKQSEFRHLILRDEDEKASTHPDTLGKTCAQSGCHEFSENKLNAGFVKTDLHSVDQVGFKNLETLFDLDRLGSNWHRFFVLLISLSTVFILGSIFWVFFGQGKKKQSAILGDSHFEKHMIGRAGKKSRKKKAASKPRPPRAGGKATDVEKSLEQSKPAGAAMEMDKKPSKNDEK